MAQWKRAGPITQRSVDRNHALLTDSGLLFFPIKDESVIYSNNHNIIPAKQPANEYMKRVGVRLAIIMFALKDYW